MASGNAPKGLEKAFEKRSCAHRLLGRSQHDHPTSHYVGLYAISAKALQPGIHPLPGLGKRLPRGFRPHDRALRLSKRKKGSIYGTTRIQTKRSPSK